MIVIITVPDLAGAGASAALLRLANLPLTNLVGRPFNGSDMVKSKIFSLFFAPKNGIFVVAGLHLAGIVLLRSAHLSSNPDLDLPHSLCSLRQTAGFMRFLSSQYFY